MSQIDELQKRKISTIDLKVLWSTDQNRTYTTAVATIIVVILMIVFAIVPAYSSITSEIKTNQDKTKYLSDLSTKVTNLNNLIDETNNEGLAIDLMNTYLSTKSNNELIIANFSQIASANNCILNNISFQNPQIVNSLKIQVSNISAVPFTLSFSCPYNSLEVVYSAINKFPVPILITSISYTNDKSLGGGGSVNFTTDKFAFGLSGEYYFTNVGSTTP